MFKLVIQDDEGKTTVVPLIRDEITIGRKEGNTIRLTERNVSRRHARILRNNGEVQIEDLGSYNGIRVNNARIAERVSLRISDQVQIGDYKLYLKAEGVEQVDDARTMPIERVEAPPPTDIMPAVTPAPTAQIPATPPPGAVSATAATAPRAAALGTADTDPSGRPVATAAQVAALSATPTHGKLVCVSSNMAGKEWELTRSHMVIGRTEDNDIIINHRSISRNNVRITRDPQSGRYTITDVGSSNGVRVNGQEYKNVELRRGDIIDLGHVRLRFVEPGEDFVFARDAQIMDVPETGGRRGLMVALVLGLFVVAGVVMYVMFKGGSGGGGDDKHGDNNPNGSQVAVTNPNTNGSENGSNQTTQQVTPPEAIDARVEPTGPDDSAILTECNKYKADKDWQSLLNCTKNLSPGAQRDELTAKAQNEARAESEQRKLYTALGNGEWKAAKDALGRIDTNSVYFTESKNRYDAAFKRELENNWQKKARVAIKAQKCSDLADLIKDANAMLPDFADALRTLKCTERVAVTVPKNPGNGSGSATVVTPPAACNAEQLASEGRTAFTNGSAGQAAKLLDASLRCKDDPSLYQVTYLAVCRAGAGSLVKRYYTLATNAGKDTHAGETACLQNKLDPKTGKPL